MSNKLKLKNKQSGFTIIEVVIVLAIAALILLIVFLAVPALQRNQRNTARKSDVGRTGAAVTEFVSNNNGKLPANSTAATAGSDAQKIRDSIGNLNQYDFTAATGTPANFIVSDQATVGTGTIASLDVLRVVTKATCGTGGQVVAGTTRQSVVQYATETSGGTNPICQDV